MNKLLSFIQNNLELTDYQIDVLRFFIVAIISEVSKFLLLGVFFLYTGTILEYLIVFVILMIIRPYVGGLHFQKYYQCFIVTCLFFICSIIFLPQINLPNIACLLLLFICAIVTYYIGPITSIFRQKPKGILLKKSKSHAATFIFLYLILMFIIPDNHYIIVGFWGIIMQTLQLVFAYLLQKRRCKN